MDVYKFNVISIDFFITTQYTFSLIKASNQTHLSFFDDLKEVDLHINRFI